MTRARTEPVKLFSEAETGCSLRLLRQGRGVPDFHRAVATWAHAAGKAVTVGAERQTIGPDGPFQGEKLLAGQGVPYLDFTTWTWRARARYQAFAVRAEGNGLDHSG